MCVEDVVESLFGMCRVGNHGVSLTAFCIRGMEFGFSDGAIDIRVDRERSSGRRTESVKCAFKLRESHIRGRFLQHFVVVVSVLVGRFEAEFFPLFRERSQCCELGD